MRVITWNVGNRKKGQDQWKYLCRHNPDLILLQECREPAHYLSQDTVQEPLAYAWEPVQSFVRPKGVAIFAKNLAIQKVSIKNFGGRVLGATITPHAASRFIAISVHVETTGKEFDTAKDAFREILREIAPILRCGEQIILGGDLNLTVHWSAEDVPVRDQLVADFGLTNCTDFLADKRRLNQDEISMLRGYPHQDDYVFVTNGFRVKSFDVLDDAQLSDHHPVLVDPEH